MRSCYILILFLAVMAAACGGETENVDELAVDSLAASDTTGLLSGNNIVQLIHSEPRLSILATMIDSSGMSSSLESSGPFTVFAPNDEAFNRIGQDSVNASLQPVHREQLQNLLLYHVAEGRLTPFTAAVDSVGLTLQGDILRIGHEVNGMTVNGVVVEGPGIEAHNGIIYIVDQVLEPADPAGL